jgi:hypothetical protein
MRDQFKGTGLLERMGSATHDFEPDRRTHPPHGRLIELDDRLVVAADDQQRRGLDPTIMSRGPRLFPKRHIRRPCPTTLLTVWLLFAADPLWPRAIAADGCRALVGCGFLPRR